MRTSNVDPSGQFALDANALAGLRDQAKTDPKAALSKAAGQFEALFMQMLLKQMRDALPQDGPLSSETSKTYTTMFDQQLAQQLSKSGVGLKQVIERQLARQLPTQAAAADARLGRDRAAGANVKRSTPWHCLDWLRHWARCS